MNKASFIFSIDKLKVEEGDKNKKIIKGVLNFINVDDAEITKETMLFKFATVSSKKVDEIIYLKNNGGIFLGCGRIGKVNNNFFLNITELNSIDKIKKILTANHVKEEVKNEQENEEQTKDEYGEPFEGGKFRPPLIAKGVKL